MHFFARLKAQPFFYGALLVSILLLVPGLFTGLALALLGFVQSGIFLLAITYVVPFFLILAVLDTAWLKLLLGLPAIVFGVWAACGHGMGGLFVMIMAVVSAIALVVLVTIEHFRHKRMAQIVLATIIVLLATYQVIEARRVLPDMVYYNRFHKMENTPSLTVEQRVAECKKLSTDPSKTDSCIQTVVTKEIYNRHDPTLCNLMQNQENRSLCYSDNTKDLPQQEQLGYCQQLTDQRAKDTCLLKNFIINMNVQGCESIVTPDLKQACLQSFSSLLGDPSYCDYAQNDELKYYCVVRVWQDMMRSKTLTADKMTICDKIASLKPGTNATACYMSFAAQLKDPSICSRFSGVESEECLKGIPK